MTGNRMVQPKITVLDSEQMSLLHRYSLRLLATTGIRVDSERARSVFNRFLGPQAIKGDRVRFQPEIIEWALTAAPSSIDIFDRLGNPAFCLGNDRMRFGIGVTALNYQEPANDEVIPFKRQQMAISVRLGHTLPKYDVVSTVGVIQDRPPEDADLYAALEMVANTTKPLVILVSDEKLFAPVLDLLTSLGVDLSSKPSVIPYFNPVTPLVLDAATSNKMLFAIERGLPIIVSNYSMAGLSSPITPAGNLVMLNAELLAGLAFSQMVKEGTPVILGSLPNYFDMKTLVSFYDPLSILMSLACAEMMAHYRLPHCGTSGSANGWGPDLQAAEMYWMNHLTGCMGKSGLAPFVGDTLGAKAFSPVNVVYGHEVIAQSLRLCRGFDLDEQAFSLADIDRVGPGGHFLTVEQTLAGFRDAYYSSPIFPRWNMEKWLAQGRPRADALLREYTQDLLNHLKVPADHDDLIANGEAIINRLLLDI